jgi:hypothetical protein
VAGYFHALPVGLLIRIHLGRGIAGILFHHGWTRMLADSGRSKAKGEKLLIRVSAY